MRLIVFTLSLILTGCISSNKQAIASDPSLHCPAFALNGWQRGAGADEIDNDLKSQLIDRQKFAVPNDYLTLWFKKSNTIGLCIIPNDKNRGASFGCGTAYAIFSHKADSWVLDDQKVTICSN